MAASTNGEPAADDTTYMVEELLDPAAELLETCPLSFVIASRLFAHGVHDRGNYSKAAKILERLLSAQARVCGNEHIEYMRNIYLLAEVKKRQGQFEKSVQLLEPLLETRKRVLGQITSIR